MTKRLLLLVGTILLVVAFFVVAKEGHFNFAFFSSREPASLTVTTSFYPLYFFTSQIVGNAGVVYNITPSGAEPHDYEPTTQDIARISDSKLLVLNGAHLESWGDKIQDILRNSPTTVITVGAALANKSSAEDAYALDPHVWLDPSLAAEEVRSIAAALSTIDPANATLFQANAASLESKLYGLRTEYASGLSHCAKKDIVTSHAAFGYLAKAFGFNQITISGLSPDEEPSPQKLASVADFVKKNSIKYIFFENLVSPKLAETIARETGATPLPLNPIEGMSAADTASGKTYFSEMKNNLINLRTALQCQ